MAKMLTLASPAKINLFLRIIRRRDDGYHELASLFQCIDLCDRLHFEIAPADSFTCSDASLPTDHTNLVPKAVQLFRRKTGILTPFSIHLDKHIPQQAGLGGGSSNAATTLWACNRLCGRPVSDRELAHWGDEIGSDISFFLSGGTAYGTGRGECLRALNPLPQTKLWIVKPAQGLSTPQVYARLNAQALIPRNPEEMLAGFLDGRPSYVNDLEIPSFILMPELKQLKDTLLAAGFASVLMSGSGSSFFCLGDGIVPSLPGLQSFPAKFINRSPNAWFVA